MRPRVIQARTLCRSTMKARPARMRRTMSRRPVIRACSKRTTRCSPSYPALQSNRPARLASGRFFVLATLCRGPCRALSVVFLQIALADADGLGRDLHQFVISDELDRGLKRDLYRRREAHRLV